MTITISEMFAMSDCNMEGKALGNFRMVHAQPNLSLLTSIDYYPPVKVRVAELGARKLFLNVLHVIDY